MHKLDEFIGKHIASVLKESGFLRKRRSFYRHLDQCVHVVEFQSGVSYDPKASKFTITLGVDFPNINTLVKGRASENYPNVYACTFYSRLGYLTPDRCDKWWLYKSGSELDGLSVVITSAWEEYGRPWFNGLTLIEEASRIVDTMPEVRAAAAMLMARKAEAAEIITRATEATRDPERKRALTCWAKGKGLV